MATRIKATPTIDERTAIRILIGNLIPVEGVLDSVAFAAAGVVDVVGFRTTDVGLDVGLESIPNL